MTNKRQNISAQSVRHEQGVMSGPEIVPAEWGANVAEYPMEYVWGAQREVAECERSAESVECDAHSPLVDISW